MRAGYHVPGAVSIGWERKRGPLSPRAALAGHNWYVGQMVGLLSNGCVAPGSGARSRSWPLWTLATIACVLSAPIGDTSEAQHQAKTYRGVHPFADGAWHDAEEEHDHGALTVGEAVFAEVDGARVFLGDPVRFGFQGDVFSYLGAHPLPLALGAAYCGIHREHRHWFAPEGQYRESDEGVFRHVGTLRGGTPTVVPEDIAQVVVEEPDIAVSAPLVNPWLNPLSRNPLWRNPLALRDRARPARRTRRGRAATTPRASAMTTAMTTADAPRPQRGRPIRARSTPRRETRTELR